MSGVGKGIVTASVALLLKSRGYTVSVVKFENYLNVDSGLINPIEHGDPFLCNDGAETDMDIGTYEKFLDQNLSIKNFVTMGQIYKAVIDRERNFEYEGEDVEAIPHVTDEIISRIKRAGNEDQAEIVMVELGGTAGEYQNVLYYEAARIMQFVHKEQVVHIHVTYLPTPPHIGEPKTKPTQLSVKTLNSMGIHPDFIVARATEALDKRRQERLALFCSVPSDQIINAPDVDNVYRLPLIFAGQNFDEKILKLFDLPLRKSDLKEWRKLIEKLDRKDKTKLKIAIVGKYFTTGEYQLRDAYAALYDALDHAAINGGYDLEIVGINSEETGKVKKALLNVDGVIVPIGWGERGVEGKIEAIKYARENKVPYLGLCYGMQLSVVEFARNVLDLKDAHTTEVDPKTKQPVIHIIPEQVRNLKKRAYGGTMRLGAWECQVKPGTLADKLYDKHQGYDDPKSKRVYERHRHRYEFNDQFAGKFEAAGLVIGGRSTEEKLVELIELPQKDHPFFIGTQGHPEYKSRPLRPHPFFSGFLAAAEKNKG